MHRHATLILVAAFGVSAAPVITQIQRPEVTVTPRSNRNLADAQRHLGSAFDSLTAAQKFSEFDLGGQAAKAKRLILEANQAIDAAARAKRN